MNNLTPLIKTAQMDLKLLEPRRLVEVLVKALDQSNAARSDCAKAGIELANFCIGGGKFDIAYITARDDLHDALANGSGLNLLQNTFRCVVSQIDQAFCQRDGGNRYLCYTPDFARAAASVVNTLGTTLTGQHHIEPVIVREIVRSVFRECLRAYGLSEDYLRAVEESFAKNAQTATAARITA